jgi:hypothetical protein
MRPRPKHSVFLVASSLSAVGISLLLCNSVWPEDSQKAVPRVKELQQERLAVLEEIHGAAKQLFLSARTSFDEVHAAAAALLAARIEYADTQKDRIKVCDEAIQEALEWQKAVQQMVQAGRASDLVRLKAKAYVLEIQIAREKAGTDE